MISTPRSPRHGAAGQTPLAQRISSGDRLLGALLRLPNEYLVEAAGLHGFDFVIFDCEHGPADLGLIHHHIAIARSVFVPVLVRIPGTDTDGILRVLDAGAAGLLVPRVSTAADIRRTVAAASYPPTGSRGFATYTPAGRYGLIAPAQHLSAAGDHLVVLAMIEDAVGVDNAAEIAGTEGVNGTLVGPADLAVNLGVVGDLTAAEVVTSTRAVHTATRAAGRAVMVIVGRAASASDAYAQGAQLVLVNVAQSVNETLSGLIEARNRSAASEPGEL
jgi:4-hydroxy-2-oxoheptanedioate aldolase